MGACVSEKESRLYSSKKNQKVYSWLWYQIQVHERIRSQKHHCWVFWSIWQKSWRSPRSDRRYRTGKVRSRPYKQKLRSESLDFIQKSSKEANGKDESWELMEDNTGRVLQILQENMILYLYITHFLSLSFFDMIVVANCYFFSFQYFQ